MKKQRQCLAIALSVLALFAAGCNDGNEEKKEKGVVEQFSDKTAGKIVDYMKTPIDMAGDAVEKVNQQNEDNVNKELEEEINK